MAKIVRYGGPRNRTQKTDCKPWAIPWVPRWDRTGAVITGTTPMETYRNSAVCRKELREN